MAISVITAGVRTSTPRLHCAPEPPPPERAVHPTMSILAIISQKCRILNAHLLNTRYKRQRVVTVDALPCRAQLHPTAPVGPARPGQGECRVRRTTVAS